MAKHLLDLLFSIFIILVFYYGIKIIIFYFFKYVLKFKKMQDKKFRVFGKEL